MLPIGLILTLVLHNLLINQFDSKMSATAASSVANAALLFLNKVRVPATPALAAPGAAFCLPTPKPPRLRRQI